MGSNSMENSIEGYTPDNKKKKRIIAIIIAAVLLVAAVIGFFIYNSAITAVTMRIQRLVGTVNLYNEEGNEQSLREKMRLGAGQTVTTAGESLIMVSLDDTKLMTMEETSKAEIKTRGKKLLFNLLEGNLFFNVTEKLADNESFDVNTTTMVCGIRGTSAYVGRDSTSHEVLMVTDGLVHVVATNPVTKETTEVDVPAGQMITIYLDEEAEGDKTISIVMQSFKEEDLPALALDAIHKDKALLERITKATGFSAKKMDELTKVCTREGVSMFGSAADTLAASGITDSIPFMGKSAWALVETANRAVDIAGSDLPLEIAIITGAYNAADRGRAAGFDNDGIYDMATAAGGAACLAVERAIAAGLAQDRLAAVASSVNGSTSRSIDKMISAGLSAAEVTHVVDTIGIVYQRNIDEAAATGGASNVGAAIESSEEHVDTVVAAEMAKSSDGDTTSDALLAKSPRSGKSSAEGSDGDIEKTPDTDDTNENGGEGEGAGAGNDGNANADTGTNTAGRSTGGGDYAPTNDMTKPGYAVATNASNATELRNAHNAIAVTDPNTGVVALQDGTLFDPAYYAAANPDVVASFGTSTDALLAHYLRQGKSQGRTATAPTTTEPKPDWLIRQEQQEREAAQSNNNNDDDSSSSSSSSSGGSSGGSGGGGSGGGGGTPVNFTNGTTAELTSTGLVIKSAPGGVATVEESDPADPSQKFTPFGVTVDSTASPAITTVNFEGGIGSELPDFLTNNPTVQTASVDTVTLSRGVSASDYNAQIASGSGRARVNARSYINNMSGSSGSTYPNVKSVSMDGLTVTTTSTTPATTQATVGSTTYTNITVGTSTDTCGVYGNNGTADVKIGNIDDNGHFVPVP